MTATLLKSRAKRLRAAIQAVLNVQVSHSQALELVAKEESYPTWDAACAANHAISQVTAAPDDGDTQPSAFFDVARLKIKSGNKSDLASLFRDHSEELVRLRKVLRNGNGALVVVGGTTMSGKTQTMHSIVADIASQRPTTLNVHHVGLQEYPYPDNARVLPGDNLSEIMRRLIPSTSIVVIDELRTSEQAAMAVTMATFGMHVICTIHSGSSPVERLRGIVKFWDGNTGRLDGLFENNLFAIQQEIEWESPEAEEIAVTDRWRAMLRRKGFIKEDRIEDLIKQGSMAVHSVLLQNIQVFDCNIMGKGE